MTKGDAHIILDYNLTVASEGQRPYELTVWGHKKSEAISDVLYGLFYEDINNAADGGLSV